VQGVTGSKVAFTSVPYRAIVRFSVETAGTFELDAEMKIWVSGTPHPLEQTSRRVPFSKAFSEPWEGVLG
jgi:hypothetical protein